MSNFISCKLLDFCIKDDIVDDEEGDSKKELAITMYGLDELGQTYTFHVEDFKPFFYVKVDDSWTISNKNRFLAHLKDRIKQPDIIECKIIKRHKLYGFDAGKEHKFILFKFANQQGYNKIKYLWYRDQVFCKCRKSFIVTSKDYMNCPNCDEEYDAELIKAKIQRQIVKYEFRGSKIELYEATIPPLLRFFHLNNISPSGWIKIPSNKVFKPNKKTISQHEYCVKEKYIQTDKKETAVPYKICSFDIEASSSHGDFPIPKKNYRKLAIDILDYFNTEKEEISELTNDERNMLLQNILHTAFEIAKIDGPLDSIYQYISGINIVYPKRQINVTRVKEQIVDWTKTPIRSLNTGDNTDSALDSLFSKMDDDDEEDNEHNYGSKFKAYIKKHSTVLDVIMNDKMDREDKLNELIVSMNSFPLLQGDKGYLYWKHILEGWRGFPLSRTLYCFRYMFSC